MPYLLILMLLLAPASAFALEQGRTIPQTQSKFRLTFDDMTLPKQEKMGFLGYTLLYDVNDWFSLGGAAYGALTGQRGGFITLGLAGEVQHDVSDKIALNAGLFVGAGGGRGGYTLSGGGLMMRYHAGGVYKFGEWGNVGAGVSFVDFPNGTIHSTQPYLAYEYPFQILYAGGHVEADPDNEYAMMVPKSEKEFMGIFRYYRVPKGVKTDAGGVQYRSIQLLGAQWNQYLDDNWFIKLESEGAMGGQSTGFMQILTGLGYRLELWDGTWFKLSGSAGVAGGGNVATGGGFVVDGALSLQQRLSDHLFGEVSAGYIDAPGASFRAKSISGIVGYHFFTPNYTDDVPLSELAGFTPSHFRIRAMHQSYKKAAANWRTHHPNHNVDLLGVQIDYFMHPNLYLTGQAIAAYKGKAGAYMTGLIGVGVDWPIFSTPLYLELETLVGAAGGGGLALGGGSVWQANGGIGYHINDRLGVSGKYGYMAAFKGPLRAKVITLTFDYSFTLFSQ